jgi:cation:H+ antiporter
MGVAVVEVIVGLVVLGWSADHFIMGSAAVARYFGLPPLLIGMVVIGFGTSAPEMVVTTFAAVGGNPEIALGNAYGSNIANIALILGVTAMVTPIVVHRGAVKVEIPILLGSVVLAWWVFGDGMLSRVDAGIFMAAFAGFIAWSFVHALRGRAERMAKDAEKAIEELTLSQARAVVTLVVGLVLLVASSFTLVEGAKVVARGLGLSDLAIGLTVVAIGTSLPELASALAAARRGEHDLVIGNIVGSCIFNGLGVVGLAGLIDPANVDHFIVSRDLPVLGVLTIALGFVAYRLHRDRRITKIQGAGFVVAFVTYMGYVLATSL